MEVQDVSKETGHRTLLHSVTFSMEMGDVIGLAGPNGSGKTTLLRILAGLTRPSNGRITVMGEPLGVKSRRATGVVFEPSFFYGDLSARENLKLYARLFGVGDVQSVVGTWLQRIHLGQDADAAVRTFSKGMLQRLSIARALLHEPQILLLDEPFDGLDVRHATLLSEWIEEWRIAGKGIVLVTHDGTRLRQHANRVLRMRAGTLWEDDSA